MKKDLSRTSYKTLFDFTVSHMYYSFIGQPDGAVEFMYQEPDRPQARAFRNYGVERFMRIVPDAATQVVLDRHRLRFQLSSAGFRVVAEVTDIQHADGSIEEGVALVPVAYGTNFTFLFYITDPQYFNYTDIPAGLLPRLLPSQEYPKGNCFNISVDDSFYSYDRQSYFGDLFPGGQLTDWTGPEERPLVMVTLSHNSQLPYYQDNTKRPRTDSIIYEVESAYISTNWVYKGTRSFEGDKQGSCPLLYHNRYAMPGGLPAPTPANTFCVKDDPSNDDPNAPRHYESYIY
jgi:hypothetical protein